MVSQLVSVLCEALKAASLIACSFAIALLALLQVTPCVRASQTDHADVPEMEIEPFSGASEHLLSFVKEHPDRLMDEAFYPKPYLCGTSALWTLDGAGDKHGDALKLSYLPRGAPGDGKQITEWVESASNKLNKSFSEQKERVDVGGRLLVVEVAIRVNKDGSVNKVRILNLCPTEFQDLIVNSIRSVRIEPPPLGAETESVEIGGRFVQNYGQKIIDKFIRGIRSIYIIQPVKLTPSHEQPLR